MHATAVVPDNLAVRGMIRSVSHLVKVEVAE
jgi:ribosomal protein L30/L7E